MRIAIANQYRNIQGGLETYLAQLIPALLSAGHAVAFWQESATHVGSPVMPLPPEVAVWSAGELGADRALTALREWRPDVIYTHKMHSPRLERELQKIAPAIFYAHDYAGVCISGSKTFRLPVVQPCNQKFGPKCLLHYYPRRCGGWNPRAMVREYNRQVKRLALMENYRAILTNSEWIAQEFQGTAFADRVSVLPQPIAAGETMDRNDIEGSVRDSWRLAYVGRMWQLKGGATLLEALPSLQRLLGKKIEVTFAGDGAARTAWEKQAAKIMAQHPAIQITFTGWLSTAGRDALFQQTDLLVMPSLWPEPFGLAGLEAGRYGIPAVAFAVGGIPTWLEDGVNGVLAPGNPPQASALAAAAARCLEPTLYPVLCQGAKQQVQRFSLTEHLTKLLAIFQRVAASAESADLQWEYAGEAV